MIYLSSTVPDSDTEMDGWMDGQPRSGSLRFAPLRSVALACLSRRDGRTTRRLDSAYGGALPCLRACVRASHIYKGKARAFSLRISNHQAKLGFRSLHASNFLRLFVTSF